MIEFFSSWAEQIVIAVIIATIIELILPNNKNKKYIQMVIGVYILFNILSPVIQNKDLLTSVDEYDLGQYNNTTNSQYVIDQSSMDKRLEKIYLEELENSITKKFEEKGFVINKCTIDAELDTSKKNAGIHLIKVIIEDTENEDAITEIKKEIINEYEIDESKVEISIK